MKYSRFEMLVLVVGTTAVLGSILVGIGDGPLIVEEVVAQMLLLVVLFVAVHWGRTGGFWAAVLASLAYIALRMPLVTAQAAVSAEIVSLLLIRVLSYGLIGVVGGELCSRIKYVFAKLENSSSVDEWSQLFNERMIARSLETADSQFTRYGAPYSILLITLSPALTADLRVAKQRTIVRSVAAHLRAGIRLADEAARLSDGRFLVLLPHTPQEGCAVVAERIQRGIASMLGSKSESIGVVALSATDHADEIGRVRASLAAETADFRGAQDAAVPQASGS